MKILFSCARTDYSYYGVSVNEDLACGRTVYNTMTVWENILPLVGLFIWYYRVSMNILPKVGLFIWQYGVSVNENLALSGTVYIYYGSVSIMLPKVRLFKHTTRLV